MSNKYEPTGKNVLVEAVQISTTLALPTDVEADRYKVIATGKEVDNCAAGQTVILAGFNTPIKGTKYFLTNKDNVLCIVK
jgi:hypothetical protein